MAVRASMAAIITETRLLINDPAGGSQIFTDQQVQDHLDDPLTARYDIRYEQLAYGPSIVNLSGQQSGTASYIWADYYSGYSWWETDCVIQEGHYVVVTPAASDYITGHFQFELTPFVNGTVPGQMPPLYITGKAYDINGAARTLWMLRAALLATAYDFTADGQSFHRSQQMAMCLKMADYYGGRARARTITVHRDDLLTPADTSVEQVPLFNDGGSLFLGR
ncbi:MAG TPA: hypothetical protein VFN11_04420 [Ktedonobacterales bacterium]|nr:hypothetical protein [Ktedonobacterales bacterium]